MVSRIFRLAASAIASVMLAQSEVGTVNPSLMEADLERAYRIAAESESARAKFHAPYLVVVDDATIERLEVITELRRYVLAAEEQSRLGNWAVARGGRNLQGRSIRDDLQTWKGRVSIRTQLRFHPQNTYEGIPPLQVVVEAPMLDPLDVVRTPTFGLSSGNGKGNSPPLMGAVVETVFDARALSQGNRGIRLLLNDQELRRLAIDFSRLE